MKKLTVLFFVFVCGSLFSQSITRKPYLQMARHDAMTIRWRTGSAVVGQVWYGTDPANLNQIATESISTKDHEITLAGLSAFTKYYYAVGYGSTQQTTPGDNAHHFYTAPAPGSKQPMRIWALGDCGLNLSTQRDVRDAYYSYNTTGLGRTDAIILLGDNAYDEGTDGEYQEKFFDQYDNIFKSVPIFPSPGNHDLKKAGHDAGSQTGPYFDNFTMPKQGEIGGVPSGTEAYYSFNYGNIHFISLESYETPRGNNDAMANWLKSDLASNNQQWIIAYWHHPPYDRGGYDSDKIKEEFEMRQNIVPILEQYGVDMILCGHSHVYQRSFLLNGHYGNSNTLTPQMIMNGGSGKDNSTECPYYKTSPAGTVYVVSGSAGINEANPFEVPPLDHPAMYTGRNKTGSFVLEVSNDRLEGKFISGSGNVLDNVVIIKNIGATSTTKTICQGESVVLSASWNSGSYIWNTGANSKNVTVAPGASTTYSVSDARNCIQNQFTVNVDPLSDVGVTAINNPSGTICSTSFSPVVKIKNHGATTVTQADIKYQLDNGQVKTYNWTGTMNPGQTKDITLPTQNSSIGNHSFKAFTLLPNGCNDANAGNDQETENFKLSAPDAGITAIQQPGLTLCGNSFQPQVTIKNHGQETLSSLTVSYKIDNQAPKTYSWTGSLTPGASSSITLPTETINPGQHSFQATTNNPNTCTDINNNNNAQSVSFISTLQPDAGIVLVNRPFQNTCGNTIVPQVTIQNFSGDTIYNVQVNYRLDNGSWQQHTWTGKIMPNSFKWAAYLPAITIPSFGNHTLQCYSTIPNGCIDVNHQNDTIVYAFTTVDAPGNTDASPVKLTTPGDTLDNNFSPTVELKNLGANTLLNANIRYRIDQGNWSVFSWNGNLATQASVNITLPVVSTSAGQHILYAVSEDPNGCNDVKITNDTIWKSFFISEHDAALTTLITPNAITPDTVRPEVILKNQSNVGLRYIELTYQVDQQPPVSQTLSTSGSGLPPGGTIHLKLNPSPVSAGNHDFIIYSRNPNQRSDKNAIDDTLRTTFASATATGVSSYSDEQIALFPNPTTGMIQIKISNLETLGIYNAQGQLIYFTENPSSSVADGIFFDFSNHIPGIYYLQARTTAHDTFSRKIIYLKDDNK